MRTNVHVTYPGCCREAFAAYARVFDSPVIMTMTWGETPGGSPFEPESDHRVTHTAIKLDGLILMGGDSPVGEDQPISGVHVSLEIADEARLRQIFAELSEGGTVQMPLCSTFWSPLFGMVKDRFGLGWMIGILAAEA